MSDKDEVVCVGCRPLGRAVKAAQGCILQELMFCTVHSSLCRRKCFPFCTGVGNVGISMVPLPAVRAKLKTCVSQRGGHQRLSPSNNAMGWSDTNNKKALSPLMYKSLSSVYLNKTAYLWNRFSGKFWGLEALLCCVERSWNLLHDWSQWFSKLFIWNKAETVVGSFDSYLCNSSPPTLPLGCPQKRLEKPLCLHCNFSLFSL